MHLSRIAKKFSTIPIDGWNGGTWTNDIGFASLEVFQRFISDREFIFTTRVLITDQEFDPQYSVIRLPKGDPYLLSSPNYDMAQSTAYSIVYLAMAACEVCNIITLTTTTAASGMETDVVKSVSQNIPCAITRISSTKFRVADSTQLPKMEIYLPGDTALDIDNIVRIGTTEYTVEEFSIELGFLSVLAVGQDVSTTD